uniref:Uncharacterized protein n=1 Tax=Glossina austeni TaxID=7395 RepID=A0A1A9UJP4_GLOAU
MRDDVSPLQRPLDFKWNSAGSPKEQSLSSVCCDMFSPRSFCKHRPQTHSDHAVARNFLRQFCALLMSESRAFQQSVFRRLLCAATILTIVFSVVTEAAISTNNFRKKVIQDPMLSSNPFFAVIAAVSNASSRHICILCSYRRTVFSLSRASFLHQKDDDDDADDFLSIWLHMNY